MVQSMRQRAEGRGQRAEGSRMGTAKWAELEERAAGTEGGMQVSSWAGIQYVSRHAGSLVGGHASMQVGCPHWLFFTAIDPLI